MTKFEYCCDTGCSRTVPVVVTMPRHTHGWATDLRTHAWRRGWPQCQCTPKAMWDPERKLEEACWTPQRALASTPVLKCLYCDVVGARRRTRCASCTTSRSPCWTRPVHAAPPAPSPPAHLQAPSPLPAFRPSGSRLSLCSALFNFNAPGQSRGLQSAQHAAFYSRRPAWRTSCGAGACRRAARTKPCGRSSTS